MKKVPPHDPRLKAAGVFPPLPAEEPAPPVAFFATVIGETFPCRSLELVAVQSPAPPDRPPRMMRCYAASADEAARLALELADVNESAVYFCPVTRGRPMQAGDLRGANGRCGLLSARFPIGLPNSTDADGTWQNARRRLSRFHRPPTVVIETAGELVAFWRLERPSRFRSAACCMQQFAGKLGAEPAAVASEGLLPVPAVDADVAP